MISAFLTGLVAIGDFLDRHNGAISAISTVFVALFTYTLWRATTRLWQSSQRHARHLEESIAEAGRSATAMEHVSVTLADTAASAAENTRLVREMSERQARVSALQLRAYFSIQFGTVVPQDNETGYRFEPRMLIINTGHTPGYQVRHRINANVLPFPLPADFEFPLPDFHPEAGIGTLGPQQRFIIGTPVPHLYSDAEILQIRNGVDRRIYIWGAVVYRDAFEVEQFTNFCQSIIWLSDGSQMSFTTR
jgi:hypothetical protein